MSETFSKVEVITVVARRRRFTTEQKLAVVAETMQPGMSQFKGVATAAVPDIGFFYPIENTCRKWRTLNPRCSCSATCLSS